MSSDGLVAVACSAPEITTHTGEYEQVRYNSRQIIPCRGLDREVAGVVSEWASS